MKLKELLQLIEEVAKKANTSAPMLCGGVPRDKILNRADKIEDLDITTGDKSVQVLSKELSIVLSKNYNLTYKTMDDGHSSIFFGNFKLDFSSNFNVPNIENILKDKGIKDPIEMQKELFSRDFTCNALLMTLDLQEVIDPTNLGFTDINKKIIRTCLEPAITFTSNKNRVVRAIYLAAKLNFDIDEKTMKWIKKHPASIKFSSEKALKEKLNKAILINPKRTTYLLDQLGLWDYIIVTDELYPYYMKRTNKT